VAGFVLCLEPQAVWDGLRLHREGLKMSKELPDVAKVGGGGGVLPSLPAAGAFVEGLSPSMRAVGAVIRELAQSEVPVLLLAEKGAGKHATARWIHEISRRSAQPFRSLVCSTLKVEDLGPSGENGESEQDWFRQDRFKQGWFKQGTIFLDEIADLSLQGQARIMELLPRAENARSENARDENPLNENRGSGLSESARLICGSERDLELEVKAGRLREDLYYRISGVCLRLPPLRQRREDIPLLVEHFLAKYARDFRRPVPRLSAEAQQLFRDYSWPGNVRELENAARAIVALGDEDVAMGGLRALLNRPEAGGNGTQVSLKQVARAASRVAERELILRVLTRTRWNRRRAAQELQISYKALLYKMKQIGCSEYGSS
jgi:two-component system, NtrC family, response regulator AtoC